MKPHLKTMLYSAITTIGLIGAFVLGCYWENFNGIQNCLMYSVILMGCLLCCGFGMSGLVSVKS